MLDILSRINRSTIFVLPVSKFQQSLHWILDAQFICFKLQLFNKEDNFSKEVCRQGKSVSWASHAASTTVILSSPFPQDLKTISLEIVRTNPEIHFKVCFKHWMLAWFFAFYSGRDVEDPFQLEKNLGFNSFENTFDPHRLKNFALQNFHFP